MDFSKIFNFLGKVAKDAVKDYVGDFVEGRVNIGGNSNVNTNYDIPSEFSDFPAYPGKLITKPITTNTSSYSRLTFFYKGTPVDEYYDTLSTAGYIQYSSVRYDKDSTYVIVERIGNTTKIAYHIKK